jgi:DNA-binding SARP family transcriptional activator
LSIAELAAETAHLEAEFGSLEAAERALARGGAHGAQTHEPLFALARAEIALRRGDPVEALAAARLLEVHPLTDAAGKLRVQLLRARIALALAITSATELSSEAMRVAESQHSAPGRYLSEIVHNIATGMSIDGSVAGAPSSLAFCWSFLAEEVANCIDQLSPGSLDLVRAEAARRPERWRSALRLVIAKGTGSLAAALALADIANRDDASFLRLQAASRKGLRQAALRSTRRLAQSIQIHDLGPVEVHLGGSQLPRAVRRKVLALVCFLSSRSGMAANREELLEALWPELAPDAASNSLHQAIYHWRRMLEPDYREWATAEYVAFDGDVVTFNPRLVDTSSRSAWRLLREGGADAIDKLVEVYVGKYAIDFAYEDWAHDYRETLHSAVLGAVELEISRRRTEGEHDSAIRMAQRLLAIDPQADAIELELIRTYKGGARQAAAVEQYAHYAAFVRQELGTEPTSFGDL